MVIVSGTMRMDPAATGPFMEAAAEVVRQTRGEEGCLAYHFSLDQLEPGLAHIYEAWVDEDALNAHLTLPHVATFRAAISGLGERTTDIVLYEATAIGRPGVPRG